MPQGMFLIGWDDNQGSVIEAKFPNEAGVDEDKITHYLSTIYGLATSQTFIIADEKFVNLISRIENQVSPGKRTNYSFLILILDSSEKQNQERYKIEIKILGDKIKNISVSEQKRYFFDFAKRIFHPPSQKIVFVGFPDAGKTSTKLFLFEKIKQERILNTTIQPTEGVDVSYYKFIDLNISLFDTSGQELNRWFQKDEETLHSAEMIIFFFSVWNWIENSDIVKDNLKKIIDLKSKEKMTESNVIIFCHKIDLLTPDKQYLIDEIRQFISQFNTPIFFTSIKNGGNQDLILGIQLILERFSSINSSLNQILLPIASRNKMEPLILLDNYHRVVLHLDSNRKYQNELDRILKFYPNLLFAFTNDFYEELEILIFQQKESFVCIRRIHQLIPDFSYIFLISKNLGDIEKFNQDFIDLVKKSEWIDISRN
jgi:small GTP-binding protein